MLADPIALDIRAAARSDLLLAAAAGDPELGAVLVDRAAETLVLAAEWEQARRRREA